MDGYEALAQFTLPLTHELWQGVGASENAVVVCGIMDRFLHDSAYWEALAAGCLEMRTHESALLSRLRDPVFSELLKEILLQTMIAPSSALLLASQIEDAVADPANALERFSIETFQLGVRGLIRTTRDQVRRGKGIDRDYRALAVSAWLRDTVRRSVLAMGAGAAIAAGAWYTQVDEVGGLAAFTAAVALLRDALDQVA